MFELIYRPAIIRDTLDQVFAIHQRLPKLVFIADVTRKTEGQPNNSYWIAG